VKKTLRTKFSNISEVSYTKSCKISHEIVEAINQRKDILCSRIRRLLFLWWQHFHNWSRKSVSSHSNVPFFCTFEQVGLNFIFTQDREILKRNDVGGLTHPGFKTYYKGRDTKVMWYQNMGRHIDQWNRIEGPEIIAFVYGQLISDLADKTIWWEKDKLLVGWVFFWWHWNLNSGLHTC
jgi:hypothetical protein